MLAPLLAAIVTLPRFDRGNNVLDAIEGATHAHGTPKVKVLGDRLDGDAPNMERMNSANSGLTVSSETVMEDLLVQLRRCEATMAITPKCKENNAKALATGVWTPVLDPAGKPAMDQGQPQMKQLKAAVPEVLALTINEMLRPDQEEETYKADPPTPQSLEAVLEECIEAREMLPLTLVERVEYGAEALDKPGFPGDPSVTPKVLGAVKHGVRPRDEDTVAVRITDRHLEVYQVRRPAYREYQKQQTAWAAQHMYDDDTGTAPPLQLEHFERMEKFPLKQLLVRDRYPEMGDKSQYVYDSLKKALLYGSLAAATTVGVAGASIVGLSTIPWSYLRLAHSEMQNKLGIDSEHAYPHVRLSLSNPESAWRRPLLAICASSDDGSEYENNFYEAAYFRSSATVRAIKPGTFHNPTGPEYLAQPPITHEQPLTALETWFDRTGCAVVVASKKRGMVAGAIRGDKTVRLKPLESIMLVDAMNMQPPSDPSLTAALKSTGMTLSQVLGNSEEEDPDAVQKSFGSQGWQDGFMTHVVASFHKTARDREPSVYTWPDKDTQQEVLYPAQYLLDKMKKKDWTEGGELLMPEAGQYILIDGKRNGHLSTFLALGSFLDLATTNPKMADRSGLPDFVDGVFQEASSLGMNAVGSEDDKKLVENYFTSPTIGVGGQAGQDIEGTLGERNDRARLALRFAVCVLGVVGSATTAAATAGVTTPAGIAVIGAVCSRFVGQAVKMAMLKWQSNQYHVSEPAKFAAEAKWTISWVDAVGRVLAQMNEVALHGSSDALAVMPMVSQTTMTALEQVRCTARAVGEAADKAFVENADQSDARTQLEEVVLDALRSSREVLDHSVDIEMLALAVFNAKTSGTMAMSMFKGAKPPDESEPPKEESNSCLTMFAADGDTCKKKGCDYITSISDCRKAVSQANQDGIGKDESSEPQLKEDAKLPQGCYTQSIQEDKKGNTKYFDGPEVNLEECTNPSTIDCGAHGQFRIHCRCPPSVCASLPARPMWFERSTRAEVTDLLDTLERTLHNELG